MDKITKEIAQIIEFQMSKQYYDIQSSGLSTKQVEDINDFVKGITKSGVIPYPLKYR